MTPRPKQMSNKTLDARQTKIVRARHERGVDLLRSYWGWVAQDGLPAQRRTRIVSRLNRPTRFSLAWRGKGQMVCPRTRS